MHASRDHGGMPLRGVVCGGRSIDGVGSKDLAEFPAGSEGDYLFLIRGCGCYRTNEEDECEIKDEKVPLSQQWSRLLIELRPPRAARRQIVTRTGRRFGDSTPEFLLPDWVLPRKRHPATI